MMSYNEAHCVDLLLELGGSQRSARDLWQRGRGSIKMGSLYTTLNRCCNKGFLEDYWDRHHTGAERRMYKVTAHGRAALRLRRGYMAEFDREGAR